jgi:hypothetical protein
MYCTGLTYQGQGVCGEGGVEEVLELRLLKLRRLFLDGLLAICCTGFTGDRPDWQFPLRLLQLCFSRSAFERTTLG